MSEEAHTPTWQCMKAEYDRMPSQADLQRLWKVIEAAHIRNNGNSNGAPTEPQRPYKIKWSGNIGQPQPHHTDPWIHNNNGTIEADCGSWTWKELFETFGAVL